MTYFCLSEIIFSKTETPLENKQNVFSRDTKFEFGGKEFSGVAKWIPILSSAVVKCKLENPLSTLSNFFAKAVYFMAKLRSADVLAENRE